jgi:pimeloyl-ACP methyl ester carboxylesterase
LKGLTWLFLSRDPPDFGRGFRARIEALKERYGRPELLREPERFFRPTRMPAQVRVRRLGALAGGTRLVLTFPSTYEAFDPDYRATYARYVENNVNRVLYLRHHERGRPAVVCLHTWGGGFFPLEEHLLGGHGLYRRGLDVALLTLPFHGARTPAQARFSGQLFPNRDLRRTNEAFGQSVADLRILSRWLREAQGCGPIGLWGMSLGGYLTALMASLDPSLAFAVSIVAPSSFADVLWHHGPATSARREAEAAGFTLQDFRALWAVHCPLSRPARLPHDRLLILWGEGDEIVPAVHALALWEHWGRPAIRSFPGGHFLQLGRGAVLREAFDWVSARVFPPDSPATTVGS